MEGFGAESACSFGSDMATDGRCGWADSARSSVQSPACCPKLKPISGSFSRFVCAPFSAPDSSPDCAADFSIARRRSRAWREASNKVKRRGGSSPRSIAISTGVLTGSRPAWAGKRRFSPSNTSWSSRGSMPSKSASRSGRRKVSFSSKASARSSR